MQIHRGKLSDSLSGQKTAVTIGSFDGLHVGHRVILGSLINLASANNEVPLAVTFDPHPRSILRDEFVKIPMLYSFDERMRLISSAGIEHVFVIDFTDEFRMLKPREFVLKYIVNCWNAGRILAGFNHSFGKDRTGDRESLISLGSEFGFGVEIVQPVIIADAVVSSTAIRKLLLDGDMPTANEMLGRKFSLTGIVVRGFGRGRRMNCPTANLSDFAEGKIVPRDGIYAAIAEVNGFAYPAAVSIGYNPTFGGRLHSVEAHLIDFDDDLYDQQITLRFVKRIRGEIKFSGEDSLSAQMHQDIVDIKTILTGEGFSLEPYRLTSQENII